MDFREIVDCRMGVREVLSEWKESRGRKKRGAGCDLRDAATLLPIVHGSRAGRVYTSRKQGQASASNVRGRTQKW